MRVVKKKNPPRRLKNTPAASTTNSIFFTMRPQPPLPNTKLYLSLLVRQYTVYRVEPCCEGDNKV